MSRKTTKQRLARFMDPDAFAEKVGKARKEAMKSRREISLKRADAAIRFFKKQEPLPVWPQYGLHEEN